MLSAQIVKEDEHPVFQSFVTFRMHERFLGTSLRRCHEVFFVSFTSLTEHKGSPVPLLLVDGIGGFRMCELIRTPRNVP